MPRAFGLRSQLLLGFTLVFLAAALSAGGITYWAARSRQVQERMALLQVLGESLGRHLAPALHGAAAEPLPRLVARFADSPLLRNLTVVDRTGKLLAGPALAANQLEALGHAMGSRQQQLVLEEGAAHSLVLSQPILLDGKPIGALRFESPLQAGEGWPRLFWAMMAVDVLLILLFIGLVLTHYVVRPLRTMQQAALRVAGGDLRVRLDNAGSLELASLADSFNQMTLSVEEQLAHLQRQREELKASRQKLIRSEKLASVGRLAAGVAHEVGNPLQAIIGFTEMLLGGELSSEQSRDFLQRTRSEAQRIHQIVRNLLDFARPVKDAIEPVALAEVVEQSLQLLGPQRLKAVSVERGNLGELPSVAASGPRLVQVLLNLFLNASDAMQGRGTLYVEGSLAADGGLVELLVANSGPPIPAEQRGRIFDPFFTTKEPGHGTGLGLSVAQSIVESYGGRLLLKEEEARTTFALQLRPWEEGAETAAEQAGQQRPAVLHGR